MGGIGSGGRNRKPGHIHIVDGTHRADRHGDAAGLAAPPVAASADVVCPESLRDEARAVWDRLAPEMVRLNLLSSVDVPVFASLCVLVAELEWSCKQRTRLTKKGGLHAVAAYRLKLIDRIHVLADKFGATPASRARVQDLLPRLTQPKDSTPEANVKTEVTDKLGRPI